MAKILLISLKLNFTQNTLGCYGLNYVILSFGKCLNYQISGFQRGNFFKKNYNIELRISFKIIFSVSERQRWAVVD